MSASGLPILSQWLCQLASIFKGIRGFELNVVEQLLCVAQVIQKSARSGGQPRAARAVGIQELSSFGRSQYAGGFGRRSPQHTCSHSSCSRADPTRSASGRGTPGRNYSQATKLQTAAHQATATLGSLRSWCLDFGSSSCPMLGRRQAQRVPNYLFR